MVEGGCRGSLSEKNPEAAPCKIRDSFSLLQRDLPLARTEPTSKSVCAAVGAYLRIITISSYFTIITIITKFTYIK